MGEKIIVIGCSGAGKSTFARTLAEKTGLPLCHLDLIWHKADKTHITREEFDLRLREWLDRPKWIIDGDFSRTLETRAEACDTIIFLDYPLEVCLNGIVERRGKAHSDIPWVSSAEDDAELIEVCLEGVASRIGKDRPDMPWIEEEFDPDFRDWILEFPKERLPQIQSVTQRYKAYKDIIVFKSRAEAAAFLDGISK